FGVEAMVSGIFYSGGGKAGDLEIFRIDNPQVLGLLNLPERPGSWRYSVAEMIKAFPQLEAEVHKAERVDGKHRNAYEASLIELHRHLGLYFRLAQLDGVGIVPERNGADWLNLKQVQ